MSERERERERGGGASPNSSSLQGHTHIPPTPYTHAHTLTQGFLSRTDEHITELQDDVRKKDEEIVFLRSMLASLSEKVDQLEKTTVGRIGNGSRLL